MSDIEVFRGMEDLPSKSFKRHLAMKQVQKVTLYRLESLLGTQKHRSAERFLICQLLDDLEASLSNEPCKKLDTGILAEKFFCVRSESDRAALLCEAGNFDGILAALNRTPPADRCIWKQHLDTIIRLGVELYSRMNSIPKALGIGDDPEIMEIFEGSNILVLPYNLIAVTWGRRVDETWFVDKSFEWPCIRRSIQTQLTSCPEGTVELDPSTRDTELRDVFGHSLLHVAMLFDNNRVVPILNQLRRSKQEVRACLSATSPSYGLGFTPLACYLYVCHDLDQGLFQSFISFSDRNICCVSLFSTSDHSLCVLNLAVRKNDNTALAMLVLGAIRESEDILGCCTWAIRRNRNMTLEIKNQLEGAIILTSTDSKEHMIEEDDDEEADEEEAG